MTSNISKEDIFNELKTILVDDLEIPEAEIKESSNLFTDLDLDSIDAVDIAVRMQRYTDKKLPPEEFKKIQTIDDVVNAVWNLMNSNE
ncbi:MAG: acyl carrier protein [Candidatus Gastranaerophilaceae bacterium]|mgnify:FL=1|jgi:acyl carrier protein|nr:acyl carrier protein [bacterium]MEE0496617.1 acyl carrier protein [Cyanobacteriota bacterium]CDE91570.1 acyl carrier protein 1 [Fusobacterium sp. CAG:815]DAA91253.1 MAG TPA: acyl carrier protein [Candidatus Gastranaerophilales bacterium HUM_7]DAA91388.1 MAG TPA: acyl carrier protein [Candidatus Gastranaerophilales bacterium HUM_6]DAB01628.1 MAG TPA: acyl carrier protein [Candidatus Gastranaerophilales bacterium HUM_12]DAB09005.1 MAG TPA: acyl carrier protein [Candidatus Gastranaerophilales